MAGVNPSCGCALGREETSRGGWHGFFAGDDFCWTAASVETGRGFVLRREDRAEDGTVEQLAQCACARRRVRIGRDGRREDLLAEMPRCRYAGQFIATERCPAYWRTAGREIDPADRTRLLPIESEDQKRRSTWKKPEIELPKDW